MCVYIYVYRYMNYFYFYLTISTLINNVNILIHDILLKVQLLYLINKVNNKQNTQCKCN